MSFIITAYPWGTSPSVFTANGQQQGIVTGVPADGSALTTVTFPLAYANAVSSLNLTIIETSNVGVYELTVQASSLTVTGFQIYVAGGVAGSTCSVSWVATGS